MAAPDVSVEKLQEREDEQEANPFATKDDLSNFATKDDLDAAVSQIVEAIEDVGGRRSRMSHGKPALHFR
jgi:hypothetical protein